MKPRRSATWGLELILTTAFAIGALGQNGPKAEPVSAQRPEPAPPSMKVGPVNPSLKVVSGMPPAANAQPTAVSPWYTEIVKMAQAGIGPQPILTFIDSAGTFNMSAEQVIYLHDLGLPGGLITAMLQHDSDLTSGVIPLPATAVPQLPPPLKTTLVTNAPIAIATATTPAPATIAIPAPEAAEEEDWDIDNTPVTSEPPAPPGFSPVRKPYPVPLTDPIVIVRAPDRIPNVISIQMP